MTITVDQHLEGHTEKNPRTQTHYIRYPDGKWGKAFIVDTPEKNAKDFGKFMAYFENYPELKGYGADPYTAASKAYSLVDQHDLETAAKAEYDRLRAQVEADEAHILKLMEEEEQKRLEREAQYEKERLEKEAHDLACGGKILDKIAPSQRIFSPEE